jgi:hypothetical protein
MVVVGVGMIDDAEEPSLTGPFSLAAPIEGDAADVGVGEPDRAVVVGAGVGAGTCVGVVVGVGVGVGAGVALGVAALVGEVVVAGQSGAVDACGNGRADGTVTGVWLACVPDRFTAFEPLPAEPLALA